MQQTGGNWPGVETSGDDFFWRPGPGLGCSAEDVCMYLCMSTLIKVINLFCLLDSLTDYFDRVLLFHNCYTELIVVYQKREHKKENIIILLATKKGKSESRNCLLTLFYSSGLSLIVTTRIVKLQNIMSQLLHLFTLSIFVCVLVSCLLYTSRCV